jgi:hypothetical protein
LPDLLSDRKRYIVVTAGNLRHHHLYVTGHSDFFPLDVVRGSKKNRNGDLPIEIFLDGLNETIRTDIGSDAKTTKARGFLRDRKSIGLATFNCERDIIYNVAHQTLFSFGDTASYSQARLPISFARQQSAGDTGPGISSAQKNHRCSRLLLAYARLPAMPNSIVEARLLDRQDASKCGQR